MPSTVLLIEDNPTTRKLVRFALSSQGIEVVEARDAATALTLFAEREFALILQDLVLPDLDGFELLGRLRDLPRGGQVPILAFSGLVSSDDEVRLSVAGFDDVVPKPIEPSRLVALVKGRLASSDSKQPSSGAGRYVVLADDDPAQRRLAEFRLRREGFEVATAANGAEVLALVRQRRPVAIVSDVLMPKMDGFELGMALRSDPELREIPLVLATNSYVESQDRDLATAAGADALVLRTPDLAGVLAALRGALKSPAGRRPVAFDRSEMAALEREHAERVMAQLEKQVALNTGAMRRNSLLGAELALLKSVSEALAESQSIDEALRSALAACFDAAAISTGALLLFENGSTRGVGFGRVGVWMDEVVGYLAEDGVRRELARVPVDEGFAVPVELLETAGAAAGLLLPLRYRGEMLGALVMISESEREIHPERMAFAVALGGQIMQALAVSRAFAEREASERSALALADEMRIRAAEIEQLNRDLRERDQLLAIAGRVARLGGWSIEVSQGEAVSVRWSDEVCRIHEAPPGTSPSFAEAMDFYAPEWRPVMLEHFTACLTRGAPYDLELEILTRNDRRVWVRAIGEAVRDPRGEIVQIQGAFQDISEWKETERKVRRLDQRLARTLESITDAFFTLDRDWRFTYVNREAERLLRRSRDHLIGRVIWAEFRESEAMLFRERYETAMRTGRAASFEAFYPPFDLWVAVRAFPSEDGLAVYFHDVTAQREAEEAQRQSEERFRLLARATTDTIWDWDLGTGRIWRSEGMASAFGYHQVEPALGWLTEKIHPEDRDQVVSSLRGAVEGSEEIWESAYRLRRQDGSWARIFDRGFVVRDQEGVAVRVVGGMTDRTEQHEARERIREQASLLDQARDAIIVHDLDGTVTFWNLGAERVYGWSSEEALGRSLVELLHPDGDAFERAREELLRRAEWVGEFQQVRKDGLPIQVEARWTLLSDPGGGGAPARVMSINSDVTEQKKLEAQFLRAQRLESIGTLAGGIAHDLNNVLSPIMMSIGLLRMSVEDEEARETLATIEQSTERGAALVRQVLAFARGVEGTRRTVDLARMVRDVGKIVRETFPKSIAFKAELPEDLWPIEADPTQVHQILLNLSVNARDAMPEGGVLTVRAHNVEIDASYAAMAPRSRPGRYVWAEVSDTGQGIPAEVIDHIFDPFFSTKEVGQGTGLGLSTVDGIVRSHGGFVTVESEPGKGTTFGIYLPAGSGRLDEDPREETPAPRRGRGELILVVDDEEPVRAITRRTLERFGYRVETAVDGAEALVLYTRSGGDVAAVLTDLRMPIMDGIAMIQALRRLDPDVRVVVASGREGAHGEEQMLALGAKAYLAKPYTADRLLRVLAEILGTGEETP